jgi:hypothetical protein
MFAENFNQVIKLGGRDRLEGFSVSVFSTELVAGDCHFLHPVLLDIRQELAEINFAFDQAGRLEEAPEHDDDDAGGNPEKDILERFILFTRHCCLPFWHFYFIMFLVA